MSKTMQWAWDTAEKQVDDILDNLKKGKFIVKIEVIPNYELESLILSFGEK